MSGDESWTIEVIRKALVDALGITYTHAGHVSDDVMNALNNAGFAVVKPA